MAKSPTTVKFTRPPGAPGVELVSAVYDHRVFPSHSHAEYVVGVIEHGAESLVVGRTRHFADAGTTLLLHPDEAHANASVPPTPLAYHVAYIDRATILDCLSAGPAFDRPVRRDPWLYKRVLSAHSTMTRSTDALVSQQALAALLAALASTGSERLERATCAPGVARAKTFIDAHFAANFSLAELAAECGLSRFHLLRIFKNATGLTPVAYRTQRRIEKARSLMRTRRSIAEIALEVGFADQSHLTRNFQRLVGVSPSQYRQQ